MSTRVIGIIAGGGDIPLRVIGELKRTKREFKVVALEGFASRCKAIDDTDCIWIKLGNAGLGISFFKDNGVSDILMVGSVKRPSLFSLIPDLWAAKFLAKVSFKSLGDDGILKAISEGLKEEGFNLIGVQEILQGIVAKKGIYGKFSPEKQALSDIKRGVDILKTMSVLDIGQAVVIQQGLVLALETIEGTDKMLERVLSLKREGYPPTLIKMKKLGQLDNVDLPTIGSKTVINAYNAGIRGIAIEAGGTLVVDFEDMMVTADRIGMFMYGYDTDE